jgi:hypothetical protein
MRPTSIIDWLALIAIIQCFGFGGLIALVGLLFWQHDQSVLSEIHALRRAVEGKLF